MPCEHMDFNVRCDVHRLTGTDDLVRVKAFLMDVEVFCKDCGLQFEFFGIPLGMSLYRPTVSMDGKEAHIPIMPPGKPPDDEMPGYGVRFTEPGTEPGQLQ